VSPSKDNGAYHTQYRQFFDKPCGLRQYTDKLSYVYKTPSNGQKEYHQYAAASQYYWAKRSPVNPRSRKKWLQDFIEDGFIHDFHTMYSKNNDHRPKLEREYFDKPVNYVQKGFLFSPKHKLPLELFDNGNSHYNVRDGAGSLRGKRHSHSSFVGRDGQVMDRGASIKGLAADLTTGMPDHMLF